MRSGFRLHRDWRTLVGLGLLAGLSGCTSTIQYRVKTSQPWPDEWVSGARVPYERSVELTDKTVAWHRKASWSSVRSQITGLLSMRRDLYGFVRSGVAQPLTGLDPSARLHYLEVKAGPCLFDFKDPPPTVTLDYKDAPLPRVIADLMKRVGRSYLISPELKDRPGITAHLVDLDWREAAVRLMLDVGVFVEPVWYNPVSLRSYEYDTQAEFIAAVRQALDNMRNPAPEAPLTIVPWEQWVRHNQAYQIGFDMALRSRPTTQRFGPPPGTAMLSADLALAKKQILYALPYQLNRPVKGTTTSTAPKR